MRDAFVGDLRCPRCRGPLTLEVRERDATGVREGTLRSSCGETYTIVAGVPRLLSRGTLGAASSAPSRTQRAFGDEWTRFPEIHPVHEGIFRWYFEGPEELVWDGKRVLDVGCGMGRWLHFARRAGASVVGMDLSRAVDVAAAREGAAVDFVQGDLTRPPLSPGSFDLVYSLGVVHHLENPADAVKTLASLVRPGGELRLYVYRSLEDASTVRRGVLALVTRLRKLTTHLPFAVLDVFCTLVAAAATVFFLWPRRVLRRTPWGDRLTRGLPLAQYTDVPFRMLVAEQFDRFAAPIEKRYRREEVEAWLRDAGLEVRAILPDLGWRAIGRRPRID